jgi:HAD superfamily hydrolase (TIGR01509 family)
MIAAIVFDFDGVLVDSEPLHLRAYQEVLEPLGLSLPREKYYASYLGYDDAGVFRTVAEDRKRTFDGRQLDALIEEKSRVFDELLGGGDIMYPGAVECVTRLAAEWPLGIASGAARQEIEAALGGRQLDRHFKFIVAAGETRAGKPAPDPYARAAELHGVAPETCVAIEDSRWGIGSAKAAGLWCIGITHTYPVAELFEADAIVTSLNELTPQLIKGLR